MNRRGFLIAASAPVVAVPAAALATRGGVVSPFPGLSLCEVPLLRSELPREALVDRYVAFLAYEHRMALWEQMPAYAREGRRAYEVPLYWSPENDEVLGVVNDGRLVERASRVLAAVGL
ncbi:hypothetical protein GCM10008179_17510 [Hansschlegelia plantiphila]|uniref:Uncharacterized protein n=1 Tax=Hansschlegelia plantiphila TaxID=374655 RepID=A0A9W6MVL7_9HYPH|nr:hypothetical protein GCM10008179_17510 [Hansschlegelia plantiphila]